MEQIYDYAWSVRELWRCMNFWQRVDVIVLAIMVAHIVVVLLYTSHHYRSACREEATNGDSRTFRRDRRKLVANLNMRVGTLNSIAFVAPYLGLAGTCAGIVTGLGRVGIEAESGLAAVILAKAVPIAFITTAAGLLVAIPAAWSYNYLRTRIEGLEDRAHCDVPRRTNRHRGVSQKFTLAVRFSKIPFSLLAVPVLAVLTGLVFMEYSSYVEPTGLDVRLPSDRCVFRGDDPITVLRITHSGTLFINGEQEGWNGLPGRLSSIYSTRSHRTLYLSAEDTVPFQNVADAVDIATNAVVAGTRKPLHITVGLMTPTVLKSNCPELR